MKPSPIGSKLLSGYAILFAGLAPAALALVGLVHGIGVMLLENIVVGAFIVYFGVRVFWGDYRATFIFALLVIVHYLSMTASNLLHMDEYPAGSRAAEMAVPRIIRGVLFAAVYAWYYLLRSKTADGFVSPTAVS